MPPGTIKPSPCAASAGAGFFSPSPFVVADAAGVSMEAAGVAVSEEGAFKELAAGLVAGAWLAEALIGADAS